MSQKIEMDKLFGPSVLNNESFMKNLFGVSSIVNNPPNTEPRAQNRPTIKFMSGNDVNVPPFNSFVTPSRSQVQSLSKNNGISYEQFSKLKLTDDNMSERPEINYHLSLSNSTAMVTDVQNNESNQGTPFPFVSSFFQSKPVEKVVTKKSTNFYEQNSEFGGYNKKEGSKKIGIMSLRKEKPLNYLINSQNNTTFEENGSQ